VFRLIGLLLVIATLAILGLVVLNSTPDGRSVEDCPGGTTTTLIEGSLPPTIENMIEPC